ncbi:unnamed protein product [Aureobasidium vineae]|uniref:Uncharacterized protein n=1 Tax=Aureobasidium vineae TaxID=2773715 RepID=A0A9N8JXY1_9PEZI|nr:unnamed protein product [Aureobasidium vineae]
MPYTLQPGGYIDPTSNSGPGDIEVDPSAPGNVMRYALGFETMANAIGGTWMVFFPQSFLGMLVNSSSDITPTAVTWTQVTGALVYALATPLILGIPNTKRGIESRAPTYYTLSAGEVGVVAVALYKAIVYGDDSGWSRNALLAASSVLAPTLAWRFYVLFGKPEWIGRYREVARKGK